MAEVKSMKKNWIINAFYLLTVIYLLSTSGLAIKFNQTSLCNDTNKANTGGTEYWAYLVAVGSYLNHPDQDRPSMLREVENLYDCLIENDHWDADHIKKIKAEDAKLKDIKDGFKWLDSVEDEDDICLVFLTTHGFHLPFDIPPFDEADGEDEALIPYEGFDNTNLFLWDDYLNYFLGDLESKSICVIVDSCYSGGFNDTPRSKNILTAKKPIDECDSVRWINGIIEDIDEKGRVVLMSSQEDEVSYGSKFSHHLIDGFKGLGDANSDDIITAEEAFWYAKPIIDKWGPMHPTILDLYTGELPLTGEIENDNNFPESLKGYFSKKISKDSFFVEDGLLSKNLFRNIFLIQESLLENKD